MTPREQQQVSHQSRVDVSSYQLQYGPGDAAAERERPPYYRVLQEKGGFKNILILYDCSIWYLL